MGDDFGAMEICVFFLVVGGYAIFVQHTDFSSSPLMVGAASLFYVPFLLMGELGKTSFAVILVPIAAVMFFFYKHWLADFLGEAWYFVVLFALMLIFGGMVVS